MQSVRMGLMALLCLVLLGGYWPGRTQAQSPRQLPACDDFAYSTEEDFVTQGPLPPDGNPIISDGDLLSKSGSVCLRNRELLAKWEVQHDLGLDAVDVLDVELELVAFSTELNDPGGRFRSGDLLVTNGVVIPNQALLTTFQVGHDLGLDGVHFVGKLDNIRRFLAVAVDISRDQWLEEANLPGYLVEYGIDIWFSTEGTERKAAAAQILDGHLLSAATGVIVLDQMDVLPVSVPAGIDKRGVDFGMDAVTAARMPDRPSVRFSTEILYRGEAAFTDGDVLRALSGAVEVHHPDLTAPFEPYARFLGVDALYMFIQDVDAGNGDQDTYLPAVTIQREQDAVVNR